MTVINGGSEEVAEGIVLPLPVWVSEKELLELPASCIKFGMLSAVELTS